MPKATIHCITARRVSKQEQEEAELHRLIDEFAAAFGVDPSWIPPAGWKPPADYVPPAGTIITRGEERRRAKRPVRTAQVISFAERRALSPAI